MEKATSETKRTDAVPVTRKARPNCTYSLELVSSDFGKDKNPRCEPGIKMIAAEIMLAGFGEP
jgi:hypothetical protein